MEILMSKEPSYIRCIKPNDYKQAGRAHTHFILEQTVCLHLYVYTGESEYCETGHLHRLSISSFIGFLYLLGSCMALGTVLLWSCCISNYLCWLGFSFYQPRIGFINSSSNAEVSTAGLQSSLGRRQEDCSPALLQLMMSLWSQFVVGRKRTPINRNTENQPRSSLK